MKKFKVVLACLALGRMTTSNVSSACFSDFLEDYRVPVVSLSAVMISFGGYFLWKNRKNVKNRKMPDGSFYKREIKFLAFQKLLPMALFGTGFVGMVLSVSLFIAKKNPKKQEVGKTPKPKKYHQEAAEISKKKFEEQLRQKFDYLKDTATCLSRIESLSEKGKAKLTSIIDEIGFFICKWRDDGRSDFWIKVLENKKEELEKEKIEMLIEQKLIVLPKCSNSTSTHKSVNEINRNRLDNFITKLKALTLKDLSDIPIGIKFLEDKIKKLKNKMKIEIPDFSIETEGRIAFVGNVTNKFEKQEHKKNKVILLYDNIKKCDKQMKILRKYQENKWLLNESRVVPKGVVPEIESFIECCYKVNEELVKDKKYKKGMLHTPESEKAVRSFLNDPLWACVYNENSQERQKSIR